MDSIAPVRWVAAFLLVTGGGAGFGQSALPPTSPTAATPTAVSAAAPVKAAHRASVVYSGGKLEVNADDSSLNQILRDIARETGMKITGGLTEERVFGKYGPGAPTDVLASLLDGTDSNMLLKETSEKVPAELILTPRQGGPTPPNPNAPGFDDDSSESRETDRYARPAEPLPPIPPAQPAAAPSVPLPDANGQPTNAVKTPQDIYQQLQQMQRQQLQQQQQQRQANPQ